MNKITIGILYILLMLICSCSKEDVSSNPSLPSDTDFHFGLLDSDSIVYNPFLINDTTIHICVKEGTDLERIIPFSNGQQDALTLDGREFRIQGQIFDFSDFTQDVFFHHIAPSGEVKTYRIVIYNLPVLILNTPKGKSIESKYVRTEGCELFLISGEGTKELLGTAGVRGRGNSTWLEPKKPYNVKFDKKQCILGMDKSKHWILLSNPFFDRTQLHNAAAFELAWLTDFPWVQHGEFVELILNGEHKGLYFICEKIGAEKNKINLNANGNEDAIDCGYLLESFVIRDDEKTEEIVYPDVWFDTGVINRTGDYRQYCDLFWEVKEPDETISEVQLNFVKSALSNLERLIVDDVSSGKYREFFDIETAINWWLVEEVCHNEETARSKNIYMYKTAGGGQVLFRTSLGF